MSKDPPYGCGKKLKGRPYKLADQDLMKRDGPACRNCGKRNQGRTIDHIMPVSKGGKHVLSNLQFLCFRCNASKSGRLGQEGRPRYTFPVRERKKTGRSAPRDATETLHKAVNYQDGPVESQINDNCELDFRDWERAYIKAHGSILRREAINSGAEKFGCSTMATRRYQDKLDSDAGPFRKFKDPESRKTVVVSREPDKSTFQEALNYGKVNAQELRIFSDQNPEILKQINPVSSERSESHE